MLSIVARQSSAAGTWRQYTNWRHSGPGWAVPRDAAIIPGMNQALTVQRIRVTFGKIGALRFVGHLDLATAWERTLRRAQVPLEYTQGFNPRPRLQFAAALAIGVTSECELFDAWLTDRLEGDFPAGWIVRLQQHAAAGLPIYALQEVPIKAPSLPQQVHSAEYVLTPRVPEIDGAALQDRAQALLAQAHIERAGHKRPYDLRPLILDLRLDDAGRLIALLKTGERGNGRPDELLAALGLTFEQVSVHRRRLFLEALALDQAAPVPPPEGDRPDNA